MERTTDGFQIAEEDLKLRGPGELLGRQQSGLPRFRFGDLSGDLELVERARREVRELLKSEGGRIRTGVGATKGSS
jgi:ATP-dependent DNA helicase RecG